LPSALWIGAPGALIVWCAVLGHTARAETYLVNPEGTGDFPNLETALEQVVDGDVIELADGTYQNEAPTLGFEFFGKAITVRSQSGHPEQCIVEYESSDCTASGFIFRWHEGPNSVLEGISITAGFGDRPCNRSRGSCSGSAGVSVLNSSPTLTNLLLQDNPVGVRVAIRLHASSSAASSTTATGS